MLGTEVIIGISVSAGCATNRDVDVWSIKGHWECYERTGENSLGMRNTITPGDPEWYDDSLDIAANGKVSIPPRGIMDEIHGRIRTQPSDPNGFIIDLRIPWAGSNLSVNATATYNATNGTLTIQAGPSVSQYSKEKTTHSNRGQTARTLPTRYYQKRDNTYWAIGKIGGGASSADCQAFVIPPQYVDFPMLSEKERTMILGESARMLMAEIDKADKEGRVFALADKQLWEFSKRCWPKTDPESITQWRKQHQTELQR